jgi:hypothetical protein
MFDVRSLSMSLVLATGLGLGCADSQDVSPIDSPTTDVSDGSAGARAASNFHVADLLAKVQSCSPVSNGKYKTDDEGKPSINICGIDGAFFWKADMDIDCDGKRTGVCNENTDDAYQPETSAVDSQGRPLDASRLPYVVIPLPSRRFDYEARGLQLGQVVGVIFNGKIAFGVFGDEGPDDIIGEASFAMAKELGIPSDPNQGGVDNGVTYIVFTGDDAVVSRLEDHGEAERIGKRKVLELLQNQ